MKLFGTDGIRGRVNEYPITAEIALRLGKAVANILIKNDSWQKKVVVGMDTRRSGCMLESAITSGLVSMGVDVIKVGVVPTPAVAHLTQALGAEAGIMITASHNPHEDNGMKIFGPDGFKLSDDLEAQVELSILGELPEVKAATPCRLGQVECLPAAISSYEDLVKRSSGGISLKGLKIVLDCGNGAAYQIAPEIFQSLGAEVIAMGIQPDGLNINEACGALHPEAAAALVKEHGADLGISLDGDADRVIFTDSTGCVVSGDRVLGLCAIGLKKQGKLTKSAAVVTIMSNLGLLEALGAEGIHVQTTPVGDRSVIECMRSHGYVFGGENSGHLIFGEYATTGDGILSAIQVMCMMVVGQVSLAELAGCMKEYPTRLVNLPVPSKPPLSSLAVLQGLMQQASDEFGQAGRYLIRYSGTESKIRILVEHRELSVVLDWTERFTQAIRAEIS